MTKVHDRMADNGLQFSNNLYQMHDELQELTTKCERDRKHWKQTGLDAERRVQDAENAMNKAKAKYNSLADSYDRARTGERQSGKFGISTKSAEKQEEDLHRKLEAADGDYAAKVQAAQSSRQDLVRTHRPQAVRNLEESIKECDAGLTLQLSKYAALSEKMLLGNGLCVSPLRSQAAGASKSLREIVQNVDNQRDFHDYILSFSAKAGSRQPDIKYEKHPALSSPQQQKPTQPPPQSFDSSQPQYGNPERTNTYDSFQQGHRPTNSGQVSGVMPYQPPDGPMSPSQQTQYQSPTVQSPYASQPPQLPQFGSFGQDPPSSADRPYSRDGPTSNQRPPQSSSVADYNRAPVHSSTLDYNRSPTQSSTLDYGRAANQSSTLDYRGPTQSSTNDGFRAPTQSSVQIEGGHPPRSSLDADTPQGGPGYHPDPRGPSVGSMGSAPGSRGPSLGQPSDFTAAGRPPQPGGYRQDGTGPGPADRPAAGAPGYPPNSHQPPSGPQSAGGYRGAAGPVGTAALPSNQRRNESNKQNLPPLRPVFGVSLDELFRRDGTAVPSIVYQCVQAVDLVGLDTEGIYRTSGSAPYIMEMKALFDHGKDLFPPLV
jgi:Rho GTPase-activating protein RGD1